ncbi:hypothetical protein OOU_Y34scaffold00693g2 [Pyricularia oryzae Y34]|uniref:Uncharacterized protein n=1 Tax=Pyricularia oryzae (strain Y34) TaxID=1143189 RepID=A0AA97NSQ2_PYRO3|nr:hypothetical protein OOU_Y34scaffold00693g2 [Pyricularia oryzae Y34]
MTVPAAAAAAAATMGVPPPDKSAAAGLFVQCTLRAKSARVFARLILRPRNIYDIPRLERREYKRVIFAVLLRLPVRQVLAPVLGSQARITLKAPY